MKIAFARIFLASVSMLVAIGAVEIFLRVAFEVCRCDDRLGWTYEPDKTAIKFSRDGEFLLRVRFNSHGFRDEERSHEKPENGFRVLLLGDSFAGALQVARTDTFAVRAEESLNAELSPGHRLEILNMGTDGFGTVQQVRLFRERGIRYRPDVVLLAMYPTTDLIDNSPEAGGFDHYIARRCGRPYLKLDGDALVLLEGGAAIRTPFRRPLSSLLVRMRLYSILFGIPESSFARPPITYIDFYRTEDRPSIAERSWQITLHLLSDFHQELSRSGIPLVVMTIPPRFVIGEGRVPSVLDRNLEAYDVERIESELGEFFAANDIGHIQVQPALTERSKQGDARLYFKVDSHWTIAGHEVAAEVIHDWFLANCDRLRLPVGDCVASQ